MSKKVKYILTCFCFITYLAHSQIVADTANKLANQLLAVSKQTSLDIIYLQTSKDIYETQEDIWFKGYVLDAQSHLPSLKSKTLFVQLIENITNKAIWEEKYEIENGFVDGHLFLSDSLQAGSYTLAAYSTNSFYKNSEKFHAKRNLQILKNIKGKPKPALIKKDSILHFTTFPEGGNLVSGIESRIAFKAENSKGMPIEVSGTLYENNTPITEFKSVHDGMGSFLFTPNFNNTYHIQLSEPKKNKKYFLPKILPSGKVLQLQTYTKDYAVFKVSSSIKFKEELIYLRIQSRGVVHQVAIGHIKGELIIKLPLKGVPEGIAEATLFNENSIPIAERLIYVNASKKISIKADLDKDLYKTREKVTIRIKATDEKNNSVAAHLGLSVFDRLYQNKHNSKNILSHYYLATLLKGNIYNPTYYFNKAHNNRLSALNLLLLTQGWRRYVWNEDNLKKLNKPLLSESINGKVRLEKITQKPEIETPKIVMAYTQDTLKGKDLIMTDAKGFFSISDKHFKMSEKDYLLIKPMTLEKPKYIIDLKDASFDVINRNRNPITTNYSFVKEEENENKKLNYDLIITEETNKLEEVIISAKKKNMFRNKYLSNLNRLAQLDLNDDFVCLENHLNCFVHGRENSTKPIEGKTYGVHIKDNIELDENHPLDWWDKTIPKVYYYPIFTEDYLLKKFNLKILKGYYGKREFYNPVYDGININDSFPDSRNNLFWKPDIITNEQGEATVEFYCSDINSQFLGVIEGISNTGLMASDSFSFNVKKENN